MSLSLSTQPTPVGGRPSGPGLGVTCRGLVYIYRLEGYDVVPATNGKQAIDYLTLDSNSHPDLIILDLMTPIVTGWQVLERLRGEKPL